MSDRVHVCFDFNNITLFFKVFNQLLAAVETVHSFILSAKFINDTVRVHNVNTLKIVTVTNFKVIRVVGRRYFHCTRTKFLVNVRIRNNRQFASNDWKSDCFTDKIFVAFVIRVNNNRSITKHCLRTRRCDFQET